MRRGRNPSRSPSRARRPVWDNPEGQLPGIGIRGDGENLHDKRFTLSPGLTFIFSRGTFYTILQIFLDLEPRVYLIRTRTRSSREKIIWKINSHIATLKKIKNKMQQVDKLQHICR